MANKLLLMAWFVLLIILMTSEFSSGANEGKACAACRHIRRRCPADCVFRPYFPADKRSDFENAHRLYTTKTMEKMLKKAKNQEERDATAKTIIFHSYVRSVNPVHGSLGVIYHLQNQIKLLEDELKATHHQINLRKHFSSITSSSAEYFSPESTNPPLNPLGVASNPLYAEYFLLESTNPSSVNDNNHFPVSGDFAYGGGPLRNPNANAFLHTDPNDIRLYPATGNADDNVNYENAIGFGQAFQQGNSVSTCNKGKEVLLDWGDIFPGETDSEMQSFKKKYGYFAQSGESSTKYDNNPFL